MDLERFEAQKSKFEVTFNLTPPQPEKLTLLSCPETIYIAVNPNEF